MSNILKENFGGNKVKFFLHLSSLVCGLIAFIVYLSTGIVREFTNHYSAAAIVFLVFAILIGILNLFKRIPGVDILPFAFYLIALLCFLAVNSNYMVAVARAIDVTSVSPGFVTTIVFMLLASITNIVGVFYKFSAGLEKSTRPNA